MVVPYTELSYFDDLIVDCLVEKVHYWGSIRKVREYKPIRGVPRDAVLKIIQNNITSITDNAAAATTVPQVLTTSVEEFRQLPAIVGFLRRFKPAMRLEFNKHLKRYLQIYFRDCQFGIEVTSRYSSRSDVPCEACVVSRVGFQEGEEIKYLCGILAELSDEDEEELKKGRDFSIINSSRLGSNCLMLGPARFVNHDCRPNARFISHGMTMKVHAKRAIEPGEEITVEYARNYFGKENSECLCVTCETLGRNGFAKGTDGDDSSTAVDSTRSTPEHLSETQSRTVSPLPKDSESESGSWSLRPRDLMPKVTYTRAKLEPHAYSPKERWDRYRHLHQNYCPEDADLPSEALQCQSCHVRFERESQPSLTPKFCPRCYRHVVLYNALWPSAEQLPEPINAYYELDPSDAESSSSESEDNEIFIKRKPKRVFAPAVSDEPKKPAQPRRASLWLKRRLSEDLTKRRTKSLGGSPVPRKRKRYSESTRKSARLADTLGTRIRKPSLKLREQ